MGSLRGTAFNSRDWSLAKDDLLCDLLDGWDSYEDMKEGASEQDRKLAKDSLQKLAIEWDGNELDETTLEKFADTYNERLKYEYTTHHDENTEKEELNKLYELLKNHLKITFDDDVELTRNNQYVTVKVYLDDKLVTKADLTIYR